MFGRVFAAAALLMNVSLSFAAAFAEDLFCPPAAPITFECGSCAHPGTYIGEGVRVETGLTQDTYVFTALDQDGHQVVGSFKFSTVDCIEALLTPGPDELVASDIKIWILPAEY